MIWKEGLLSYCLFYNEGKVIQCGSVLSRFMQDLLIVAGRGWKGFSLDYRAWMRDGWNCSMQRLDNLSESQWETLYCRTRLLTWSCAQSAAGDGQLCDRIAVKPPNELRAICSKIQRLLLCVSVPNPVHSIYHYYLYLLSHLRLTSSFLTRFNWSLSIVLRHFVVLLLHPHTPSFSSIPHCGYHQFSTYLPLHIQVYTRDVTHFLFDPKVFSP